MIGNIDVEKIKKYELLFSGNNYNGCGDVPFIIEEGEIPVMISASHSINHFREGKSKLADKYTGGICRYLHEKTGCHAMYSSMYTECDPNYDLPEKNIYQQALKDYLLNKDVFVLLDLHGAAFSREFAIELGTAPQHFSNDLYNSSEDPSLLEYQFIDDVIIDVFNDLFISLENNKKTIWKNKLFDAGGQNTVTKYISSDTHTACIQIEINGLYRNPDNTYEFCALIEGLLRIINEFQNINWKDSNINLR